MTRTEQAIEIISKMETGRRYYISDVVSEMNTKVNWVAAILFNLESKGLVTLQQLDNPQERAGLVEITTATGNPRHIIYKN